MKYPPYFLLFVIYYITLIEHNHAQTWKTIVSEFTSTSDADSDVKNWNFKRQTTLLGSCADLTSEKFLGGNSEFHDQTATRTFKMTNERVHHKLRTKFDLVLMGTWRENIFYGRMNNYLLFSAKYDSKTFTKFCSSNEKPYQVISVNVEIETVNEKNIEIALADFELPTGGFWGIRNLIISFLLCDKVYTEYDKSLQICKCIKGFYLNQNGDCAICPLGCLCEGTAKCSACTFSFMTLDTTNQVCVLSSGISVLESWANIPSLTKNWKGYPTTTVTTNYCGAYSFYGGLSVFKYSTAISRIYSSLVAHYKVLVKFLMFKLDTWDDNMSFSFSVDGVNAFKEKFLSNTDDRVGSLCGTSSFEAVRRVELALDHESSGISLGFNTNDRISSDGYWAINNFEISILLCHSSCSSCSGPSAENCKTCFSGFLRSDNTVAASTCLRDCSIFPNCKECDESKCLVCKPNFFIKETDSTCVDSCAEDCYSTPAETSADGKSICKKCSDKISMCKKCSFNALDSSITCNLCQDVTFGMEIYIRSNLCVYNCLRGEIVVETTPKQCKFCNSLHPACLTCTPSSCKSCSKPYFFEENSVTCVLTCPTGKIQDSSLDSCRLCSTIDENCAQCTGDLTASYSCTLCKNTYFLKSGSCVKTCAPNNYIKDNSCQPCSQTLGNCLECSPSTFPICKKCEANYFLKNGLCSLTPCLTTQYIDDTTRACKECYHLFPHCNTCTTSSCLECKANYYLTSDALNCVSKCGVEEYINNNKNCDKCKNKFPRCAQCSSASCVLCTEGYFLYQGLCKSFSCLSTQYYDSTLVKCLNCQDSITKCVSCYKGSTGIKCDKCDTGFNVRWDGDTTSCIDDCPSGDVLYNDYCMSCSNIISNCQVCKKNERGSYACDKCADSYYVSNFKDECVKICPEGEVYDIKTNKCISCTSTLDFECKVCGFKATDIVCLTCYDSYKILKTPINMNGESCYPACPAKYSSLASSCYACSDDDTCESCSISYSASYSIDIKCEACVEGYYLNENICLKTCPSYKEIRTITKRECVSCGIYDVITGKCVELCGLGTFSKRDGYQELCKPCSSNCDTCTENYCIYCRSNFYLDDDKKCINQCPSDTHLIRNILFTTNKEECVICPKIYPNCFKCSALNMCLECEAEYFLDTSGTCIKTCDTTGQKYYILKELGRADLGKCLSCSPSCETCQMSTAGQVECLSCASSLYYYITEKTCINSCPIKPQIRNVVSVEEVIEGVKKKICRPCSDVIPFCDECSIDNSNPSQAIVCSKCTEDRIIDTISNDCQILASEIWDLKLFSRYYPQIEETGCSQFGEISKYRCVSKNPVTFCKLHDGKGCLECLEAYFLLPDLKVCVQCPVNCFNCNEDFFLWRVNPICKDQEGNFMDSYYLATIGSKSEFKSCPSNCMKCEEEKMCIICKEGYLISFDTNINSRICIPCESVLEGCKKCSYISFESSPPTDLLPKDIGIMTNVVLFNMVLTLRKTRIVCQICDKKYYFSGEGKCDKCINRIDNCEACISLTDDYTIYDSRQFNDAIYLGNTPNFKVICYACQKKNEVNSARFTLTPVFDKCIDCPETSIQGEIKGIECQYFESKNELTFNQEVAFNLDSYNIYLKEVLNKNVLKATICPPQSCKHSDNAVCLTITSVTNCIDCTHISGSPAPTCKACKAGFYLDDMNQCSACQEGCLECSFSGSDEICTQCSTDDYTLEIFQKKCYKGINHFSQYEEAQATTCLSWGVIYNVGVEGTLRGNQWKSFCMKCLPGSYPSFRTGGCQSCSCEGCFEIMEKFETNVTQFVNQALILPSSEVNLILGAALKLPLLVSNERCSSCKYLYQVIDTNGICVDCDKDCLKCGMISKSHVCLECSKILFQPDYLTAKDLVRNYELSPGMLYPFSLNFASNINYLKDNSVPSSSFQNLNNYMQVTKFFNPNDGKICKPCPYGCSRCKSVVAQNSETSHLEQYKSNCTECRPGFYMDKIGDLVICRFCVDLDACTTALRLKYLFTCLSTPVLDRDSFKGYIQVQDFADLRNEINNLNIIAFKNMHHEAYLKELEIAIFFPREPLSSCIYPVLDSSFEIPLILNDLSHVLKIENTYLRLGSYDVKWGNLEIDISGPLKSTITFKTNSHAWNIFQFSSIIIENLVFKFEDTQASTGPFTMEFKFGSIVSFKLKNVEFINFNPVSYSNYFIFQLEQVQIFEIENVLLQKIVIKAISDLVSPFNLPNARSISIKSFRMKDSYCEGSILFSLGKYAYNLTLEDLTLSVNELKNFIFLKSNLINQSDQPLIIKMINIENSLCIGCSVLFVRGFTTVSITNFKLISSVLEFLFESISMNGLVVFNIIPNITNVEITKNAFNGYKLFLKNTEYETQKGASSILLDWKIIRNKIESKSNTFLGSFLIDFSPLDTLKRKNDLLIENLNMDSNNISDIPSQTDITIPFISIKEFGSFIVKSLKIYLNDENYYLGLWKVQAANLISFSDCSIEHRESPSLDYPFRYHLKQGLFYIENTDSINFDLLKLLRISFYESAIKIVKASDYLSDIDELSIKNSEFMYNGLIVKEFIDTGLIKIESQTNTKVLFDHIKFQENFINRKQIFYTKSASCIFFNSLRSKLKIDSSEFISNTANNIYISSDSAEIINTQFLYMSKQNGYALEQNPISLIFGGFIEISSSLLTVKESVFNGGWAYSGGAIYFTSLQNSIVIISDSKFEKLYALDKGGALLMNVESSNTFSIILKKLIVKDTFSKEQGGFLHVQATAKQSTSSVTFSNVNVEGTVALLKGSFLSSSILIVSFVDCFWINKEASNNIEELKKRIKAEFILNIDSESQFALDNIAVACLIAVYQTKLTLGSSTAENINFDKITGSILLNAVDSIILLAMVKISNIRFAERGVIDAVNSDLALYTTGFSNLYYSASSNPSNSAPFRCENCLDILLNNLTVDLILCKECKGGFLFISTCKKKVLIISCLFSQLNLTFSGGAIYSENSIIQLEGSKFINVHSENIGGVIASIGKTASITLTDCHIETTSAFNGGALYLEDGKLSVLRSVFSLIKANNSGGVVWGFGCLISIEDSSFIDAMSEDSGGAIFYEGSASKWDFVIIKSNFTTTKTRKMGGALYLKNNNANIRKSNFKSSSNVDLQLSYLYGGVIYSEGCNITINESIFSNSISDYGGMIMAIGKDQVVMSLIIESCEMTFGNSTLSGGGVNFQNLKAYLLNSNFKSFTSGFEGGIIYGEGSAEDSSTYSLQIEYCVFESAKASRGGGLMVKYLHLKVKSSVFNLLTTEGDVATRLLSSFYEKRILQEKTSQLTLDNGGGGIFALQSIMNIEGSTFSFCKSKNGGAIYFLNLYGMKTTIYICKFSFNEVTNNGGALNFEEAWRVTITDSEFFGNHADQRGGGAFSYSEKAPGSSSEFILERVSFLNNSARIGGAMKYYNPSKGYEGKELVFTSNKALNFGADITSQPKSMRLAVINKTLGRNLTKNNKTNGTYFYSEEYSIEAFRSSADINCSLIFSLLDEKGDVITECEKPEDYSATIGISGPIISTNSSNGNVSYLIINSLSTSSQTVALINNTFVFENLKFQGAPDSTAMIVIKSPQIKTDGEGGQAKIFEFKIKIYFRECLKGEFKNPLGSCDLCKEGYYSLFINENCQECPENVGQCEGNVLDVVPGFWRSEPDSRLIIPCNSKENCGGGTGTGDEMCNEGTLGALCGSCDIYGKRWPNPYTSNGKTCVQCEQKTLNIIILVFFSLMQVFFTYSSIQGVLEMSNNETAFRLLRKFYSGGGENLFISQYNYSAVYIKIFMNYITILGFISSFNIEIDTSVFEAPEAVGIPQKRVLYALDCHVIVLADLFKQFHIIYVKMIIMTLIPLALLLVFLIIYYVLYILKVVKAHLKRIIFTAIVFVVIYQQPSIIFYLFSVLSCSKIGDRLYVQADLSLECYTREHLLYGIAIGGPLTVFWGLIIPLIFIGKLWSIRKKLEFPQHIMQYGFLYSEYKTDNFFWEFIKIYQKFLMIGFLTFFESDIIIKGLLVLLVLSLYFYMLVRTNPYKFKKLYIIDIISCAVCFLSILFALLCHQNPYRPFTYLNIAVIAIINIIFSSYCLMEILNLYLFNIKKKLESAQMFVASRVPCLAKCCVFKIKKYKTLQNWRRLKIAIHKYRKALNKAKENAPKGNELDIKAIEIINTNTKDVDSKGGKKMILVKTNIDNEEKVALYSESKNNVSQSILNQIKEEENSKLEIDIEN